MLKAALIGCGKIADTHVAQIVRIKGCAIVAVCDREPLMGVQLRDRYPVGALYQDVSRMLAEARPDVVHITTPPASHFELARQCLEAGCHVYVEKPFTLRSEEAVELVKLAESRGLKITAGHDGQFAHVAQRVRRLVQSGYLGGAPVHMESVYGYELNDNAYVRAFLNDANHWVRGLPGKLAHNIISHGIARVAEYFTAMPEVMACGFRSEFLEAKGEREIVDELRVILRQPGGPTAYFTFSTQMRPAVQAFSIFGPKNGIVANYDQELLVKVRGKRFKNYAEMFVPPLVYARQCIANLRGNLRLFRRHEFHLRQGMKLLIEEFYRSIETGGEPPIPYREIVLTGQIMDEIFRQIAQGDEGRAEEPARSEAIHTEAERQ